MKSLFDDYDARSVGPEKWKVRAEMEAVIEQNKELFQKYLQKVSQYARKEREHKEMLGNLQKEFRELTDSRRQKDKEFDDSKSLSNRQSMRIAKVVKSLSGPPLSEASYGKPAVYQIPLTEVMRNETWRIANTMPSLKLTRLLAGCRVMQP